MPRKRGPKTASKATGKRNGKSVNGWDKRSDIPMDETDEFHNSRDKVLLDGTDHQASESDEEEEIFALKGMDNDSDEDEDDEENVEGEEEDEDGVEPDVSQKSKASRKSQKARKSKPPPSSDSDSEKEGVDFEESWGKKKSVYYASNAAEIDSDDEEAREMELQEAMRLQALAMGKLRPEAFRPLDELNPEDTHESDTEDPLKPVEVPSSVAQPKDRASVIRHLQKSNPETLALIQEWADLTETIVVRQQKMNNEEYMNKRSPHSQGLIHLHYQALLTYASVLAFYFYLRTSEKYASRPELLRSHPITKRLLTLKQALSTLQNIDFADSDDEDEDEDEDEEFDELAKPESLDEEENYDPNDIEYYEYLARRAKEIHAEDLDRLARAKRKKEQKSKSEANGEKQSSEASTAKLKSKKTKAKMQAPEFDVEEPTLESETQKSSRSGPSADGFGEASTLDMADAIDKSVRRKALRFHTSKIESASARRSNARQAQGGDDDIPYRQRKQQQNEQALQRARKAAGEGGDDLDDEDPEVEEKKSKKRARDGDSEDEGASDDNDPDGYYSLVKKQKKAQKAEKKARYESIKEANKIEYTDDIVDGQRSVTRAILANKGLTPRRSKTVRNPRVKKRQRYEKAKKKLASQKAVYKGGIGDVSRYDGERSGISKVVKSVKF